MKITLLSITIYISILLSQPPANASMMGKFSMNKSDLVFALYAASFLLVEDEENDENRFDPVGDLFSYGARCISSLLPSTSSDDQPIEMDILRRGRTSPRPSSDNPLEDNK